MRTLDELIDTTDPALPNVLAMIEKAASPVEILPRTLDDAQRCLVTLQITTRSPMGALAYETGGVLVDHGWLRLLGSGHSRLPRDLARWSLTGGGGHAEGGPRLNGACLVADDAIGGFFALNGNGLDGPLGHVFYLAPDSGEWEDTGRGYTDFLAFSFSGDLARFYEGVRWHGWERDVAALEGDRAYHFYPPLFAACEGGLEARSRKTVPLDELWYLHAITLPRQLRST